MRKAHNRIELDANYIAQEYTNGRTAQSIATELCVSKKTILTRLREEGITRRQQPTYPEVNKASLTEYYVNQKLSSRDVAEIFGCSNNLILKRLEQFGIESRQRVGDPSFTEEERKAKWGRPREEHNLWKGGVTGINETLRGATEEWRKAELRRNNFTCYVTSKRSGDMHVHHVTPFHEMRDKAVAELGVELLPTIADYSEEQVEAMRAKIVELHENEKGYVMTVEMHKLFHSLYGFKTDANDLEEFKTRYRLGEFDELMAVS